MGTEGSAGPAADQAAAQEVRDSWNAHQDVILLHHCMSVEGPAFIRYTCSAQLASVARVVHSVHIVKVG